MRTFHRLSWKLFHVAALLLVVVQPLLAAECPCCFGKQATGSNTELRAKAEKPCSHSCCGGNQESSKRAETSLRTCNLSTTKLPCDCPKDCPCQTRHDSTLAVARVSQSDDASEDQVCPFFCVAAPVVREAKFVPLRGELPFALAPSAKELCVLICRLTI